MKTTQNVTTIQTATIQNQGQQAQTKLIWNNRWIVVAKAVAAVVFLGQMAE
ncbi:hypothetical protein NQ117_20575 [Paenibacillus sp. SC116]|uniref:hypothetical protein n=1 Tax=Paenibacillus sp. SC116 TaxID=2968986 RepID=UPI00215AD4B2|nr:hypothetical protein [Paenibacillus sp. SC116]MCR8846080.1 hypothetical protein [Paenibacillus sp. SC116]